MACNLRPHKEFRARLIRASAAVSVVNLLGPSEIGENPASSRSRLSRSENPPGGPIANCTAACGLSALAGTNNSPPGSATYRAAPPSSPPTAASRVGAEPIRGRRLRRDCLSEARAIRSSLASRCGPRTPGAPRSHATKLNALTPSGTACSTTCSMPRRSGIPTSTTIGRESSPWSARRVTIRPTAAWRFTDSSTHS